MSETERVGTPTTIIGIDCATDPKKVGLALGVLQGREALIEEVIRGSEVDSIAGGLQAWMARGSLNLLALDAPLGWPKAMGPALSPHRAGEPLKPEPDELFRRVTDHYIEDKLGRRPLEVGANWIARTAHAALKLLDEIGKKTGKEVSLAWESPRAQGAYAIEVYPAGTLDAYGVGGSGYKRPKHAAHAARRAAILDFLEEHVALPCGREAMQENADKLDAALCVLAGVDFLLDRAVAPSAEQMPAARKEGWIWVRRKVA